MGGVEGGWGDVGGGGRSFFSSKLHVLTPDILTHNSVVLSAVEAGQKRTLCALTLRTCYATYRRPEPPTAASQVTSQSRREWGGGGVEGRSSVHAVCRRQHGD